MKEIIETAQELNRNYPDMVFIGGLATYLYTKAKNDKLVEASHDIDAFISLEDLSNMRNLDNIEVIDNSRLKKKQLIKNGIEIDIYVERNSNLQLDYAELSSYSKEINGLKLATPEHLMILKLKAYEDRKSSEKGFKDKKDLLKMIYVIDKPKIEIFNNFYFNKKELLGELKEIIEDKNLYKNITKNDSHVAKKIRLEVEKNFKNLYLKYKNYEKVADVGMDTKTESDNLGENTKRKRKNNISKTL